MIISPHFETLFCNIGVTFGCRFAAEGTTLGKDEKRVKEVLTIPIDDNGEEDLYSHLSDIIHFIGKKENIEKRLSSTPLQQTLF